MKLLDLLHGLDHLELHGDGQVEVAGIAYDSRQVEPGFLFACLPGTRTDGHRYLAEAIERGAAALLVERAAVARASCPWIMGQRPMPPTVVAPQARAALAVLAAAFYGQPSDRLYLTGVTGTNGKTTTTYLIERIIRTAGRRTGVVGTLAYRIGDRVRPAPHTTPEAPDLQSLLAEMVRAGVQEAVMEVSSHALVQHRAAGCRFPTAVFTNLSRDHLDFHADLEDYLEAKLRLFSEPGYLPAHGRRMNVINADDPAAPRVLERAQGDRITYGLRSGQVRAGGLELGADGTSFLLETPWGSAPVRLRLSGTFNVYNALAALAATISREGISLDRAIPAIETMPPVDGRFERVEWSGPFSVVVDYAHTPDGLEKALTAARECASGRLLVVFGCGGDRDPGKRPVMGEIAARLADLVFITSDNPRTEDPEAIIAQIAAGVPKEAGNRCRVEADRARAIELAVEAAEPGDLVLIAGKGHETYQIFADRTIHFDDREAAAEALAKRTASDG